VGSPRIARLHLSQGPSIIPFPAIPCSQFPWEDDEPTFRLTLRFAPLKLILSCKNVSATRCKPSPAVSTGTWSGIDMLRARGEGERKGEIQGRTGGPPPRPRLTKRPRVCSSQSSHWQCRFIPGEKSEKKSVPDGWECITGLVMT
jgi:hypothetical protein